MAASGAAGKPRVQAWAAWRARVARAWALATPAWGLAALCVALNVLEAALVAAFAHGVHPDLAPQASAMAPFGAFGDLRWVSVYDDSWAAAIGELIGVVVVRGALTGLSISLAWPRDRPAPRLTSLLARGAGATALAAVLLVPSVTLLYGTAVVPVSWLFLAAVPTALLVAIVVHPAAVRGDWWRRVTTPRAIGWVALSFVVLSLASAAIAALPAPSWPLVAILSGLFNARSWTGLVRALVAKPVTRRLVPVGALTVVVVAGSVVGGAVLGFRVSGNAAAREATKSYPAARLSSQAGEAVIVVSGYGSRWDGTPSSPLAANLTEERFSYRGLGPKGEPLPYTGADTAKPIAVLDRMLLAQVASLHRRTGLGVAVVAESEGALIAKTALLANPQPEVVALVMASPLESPGRVWYPTSSAQGWGVASSEAMRLIGDAFQDVAPIDLSPDNAFLASLDEEAPVLQNAMSCPLPGIKQAALLPLADATVTPTTEKLPFPAVVVPAFHGGVIGSPEGEKVVRDILEGRPVTSGSLLTLADTVISYASTAWQVPALAPSDYPEGQQLPKGGGLSCGQIAAKLHGAVVR